MTRRLAILGCGPTGLEAALAALEAGLPFTLYEASPRAAGNIRDWGHVRLFSPWSLDVSPRARALLTAAGHAVPNGEECPTGAELVERVLQPLADHPSIARHVEYSTRVEAVTRRGLLKDDEIGTASRGAGPFRLLLTDGAGDERLAEADVVLDCTGTWGHPNATGDGGIPAPGERRLDPELISRRIPDLDAEADEWAGRTALLVGAGHSAQTAACDLAELAAEAPGTRVLWAFRSAEPGWNVNPEDPLPERSRLTARARDLVSSGGGAVEGIYGVVVDEFTSDGDRLGVVLRHEDGKRQRVTVDRVLSLTGAVGDHSLYRQLQVHECYATSGPMKLAAALLGETSADCLAQESHGAESLVNPEPDFFILGSKSYGRNNSFLMRVGWQQVDEAFSLLL